MITYSFATDENSSAIKALLNENQLPYLDIDKHIHSFIIAKSSGSIIGSAGLQLSPPYALLRSVAVKDGFKNRGVAKELISMITVYARERNIEEMYLLTNTAEAYFTKHGFNNIDRNDLPDLIKRTEEFTSLCPSEAVSMYKIINKNK